MSKPKASMDLLVRVTFVILMGALTLFLSLIFLAVFVAVAGWYLWRDNDRLAALEERVAELEGRKKPGQS